VPLTLLGTFAVMRWFGVTLNLMSLGGLAVAIGLVVDDASSSPRASCAGSRTAIQPPRRSSSVTRDMFAAVIGTNVHHRRRVRTARAAHRRHRQLPGALAITLRESPCCCRW